MDAENSPDIFFYTCNNCKWTGPKSKLEYDIVETCLGNDSIEMCPSCGSYSVEKQKDQMDSN